MNSIRYSLKLQSISSGLVSLVESPSHTVTVGITVFVLVTNVDWVDAAMGGCCLTAAADEVAVFLVQAAKAVVEEV